MIRPILYYPVTLFVVLVVHLVCRTNCVVFDTSPQVLLIIIIFLGALRGRVFGESIGFFLGLCADVFSVGPFGAQAFIGAIVGFIAGGLRKTLDITEIRVQIIIVLLFSFGSVLGIVLIEHVFLDIPPRHALWRLALEPVLNALASPIVIWCYQVWRRWWFPGRRLTNF